LKASMKKMRILPFVHETFIIKIVKENYFR
jgi:hypothetical protein